MLFLWYDACNTNSVVLTFICTASADDGPVHQRGKNSDRPEISDEIIFIR